MSESNPMLQLSLAPSAPEPESVPGSSESIQQVPAPAAPEPAPKLDESQLTDAEKKAIEDFIKKVDVTNPDHVLLFGADAQKRIADFSQTALDAVKTQDTGEVGNMLVNLVAELKGFQKDSEEPKGLARLFSKGEDKITRMKARYSKVSANVETIAGSLESYQTQLLKDVAMFDHLYDQNSDYFHQLTLYIIAGDKKLAQVRETELKELREKAAASGDAMDAQKANDLAAQVPDRATVSVDANRVCRHIPVGVVIQRRAVQKRELSGPADNNVRVCPGACLREALDAAFKIDVRRAARFVSECVRLGERDVDVCDLRLAVEVLKCLTIREVDHAAG